jgi:hypothetical protein
MARLMALKLWQSFNSKSFFFCSSVRGIPLAPNLALLEDCPEPLAPPPEALRFLATLLVSPEDCFFLLETRSWITGH